MIVVSLAGTANFSSAALTLLFRTPVPAASPITAINRNAMIAVRMETIFKEEQSRFDGSFDCSAGGTASRIDSLS